MSSLDGPTVLSLEPTSFTDVPLRPSPSASPFGRSLDTGFMAAAVPVSGLRCSRWTIESFQTTLPLQCARRQFTQGCQRFCYRMLLRSTA